MRFSHKQKGVALITALLIVSLATILAVSLIDHLHFDTRRTENILRLDQALIYNSNTVDLTRKLLFEDGIANNHDTLVEADIFNTQFQSFPVDGGMVSARISDLQACFNLNSLSPTNQNSQAAIARYRSLLGAIFNNATANAGSSSITPPINTEILTDSLIDWLDPDSESRGANGAELDYYLGLESPYKSANGLLTSSSELSLIRGYTPEAIEQLRDFVCVLPDSNTAININTASSEVLESLGIPRNNVTTLIEYRQANTDLENAAFATIADFERYVTGTLEVSPFSSTGMRVDSEYFLLRTRIQLGTGDVKVFTIIQRHDDNTTSILRQTRGDL